MPKKDDVKEEHKEETKEPKELHPLVKYKYVIIFAMIFAFVVGTIVANYFSGLAFGKSKDEQTNLLQSLQTEKDELKSQNTKLQSDYDSLAEEMETVSDTNMKLANNLANTKALIESLSNLEQVEREYPIRSYTVGYNQYIYAKPGEDITTQFMVENTGTAEKSFDVVAKLKSRYNNIKITNPPETSISLKRGVSANVNLKFTPTSEGYAFFDIYVNNDIAGEIVVISLE